jgi:hypothetical protein
MREGDVDELRALSNTTPEEGLRRSVRLSQDNYVGFWDQTPVAVFGCYTVELGLRGVPWLLGTPELGEHRVEFLQQSKKYMKHLLARHTKLENVVHVDNRASIVYLSRLGFQMTDPYTMPNGAQAMTFYKEGFAHV